MQLNAFLNCKHFDGNHIANSMKQVLTGIMIKWSINIKKYKLRDRQWLKHLKNHSATKCAPMTCFARNINIGVNKTKSAGSTKNFRPIKKKSIFQSWKMKQDLSFKYGSN